MDVACKRVVGGIFEGEGERFPLIGVVKANKMGSRSPINGAGPAFCRSFVAIQDFSIHINNKTAHTGIDCYGCIVVWERGRQGIGSGKGFPQKGPFDGVGKLDFGCQDTLSFIDGPRSLPFGGWLVIQRGNGQE
jgi:hypothetical protein